MENQETGRRQEIFSKSGSSSKQPEWLNTLLGLGKNIPIPGRTSNQNPDERQMNRLKRQELLQILVSQSKEIDRLKKELEETREKLEDRELKIASSGSLAEASLQIFDVVNSVQKAADLYLENLKLRAEEGSPEPVKAVSEDADAGFAASKDEALTADPVEPQELPADQAGTEDSDKETGEDSGHGTD